MKKKTLIPLIIICILGLLLTTYPLISTYYYNRKNRENIDNYQEVIKTYDEEKSKEILDKAYSYNKELLKRKNNFKLDKKYDYVVDCIDTLNSKFYLVKLCHKNNVPVLSSLGSAKRIKVENIKLTTLDKTRNDHISEFFIS